MSAIPIAVLLGSLASWRTSSAKAKAKLAGLRVGGGGASGIRPLRVRESSLRGSEAKSNDTLANLQEAESLSAPDWRSTLATLQRGPCTANACWLRQLVSSHLRKLAIDLFKKLHLGFIFRHVMCYTVTQRQPESS